MAHINQVNRLKRVYAIQEYYKIKKADGVMVCRIWENVCKLFPMSDVTFYNYMNENARKSLRELNVDFDELNKYKEDVIKSIQSLEKSII